MISKVVDPVGGGTGFIGAQGTKPLGFVFDFADGFFPPIYFRGHRAIPIFAGSAIKFRLKVWDSQLKPSELQCMMYNALDTIARRQRLEKPPEENELISLVVSERNTSNVSDE